MYVCNNENGTNAKIDVIIINWQTELGKCFKICRWHIFSQFNCSSL